MKKALITGITGQDGSYLTELLLEKGYEVHGIVRRTSSISRGRLEHLYVDTEIYERSLFFHYSDLNDATSLRRVLTAVQPHEIYHLAGQSHVGLSFDIPEVTANEAGFLTLGLLEIVRDLPNSPKLFHASSSEIFGVPSCFPQSEQTAFHPVNPYGASKAFATNIVRIYRESYGMFLVNGVMYSHESPRRGDGFATKKICRSAASIASGRTAKLRMGNINVSRDWGHAKDYVKGMWLSLQHDVADDYIFSSGVLHELEEVLEIAFSVVGLDWRVFYEFDERFARPSESFSLVGDSNKARSQLGWVPQYTFKDIIREMVEFEVNHEKKRLFE